MRFGSSVSRWIRTAISCAQKVTLKLLYMVTGTVIAGNGGWHRWRAKGKFRIRYNHCALGFLALFVLTGSLWAQKIQHCRITSDTTPPAVDAGGTHTFTASCTGAVWSVTGGGSINPSTGVYTAPATVWAQDVSRGQQLLPNNNAYKLPINGLPVDSRSSYWLQRVVDDQPQHASYHTFKLFQPGLLDFYDNVVNNSTPTQLMHFYYGGPYQDTLFPIPMPPNVNMQNGWSQDVAAGLDRHIFSINNQTGDDAEMYNFYIDYRTIAITPGNPTTIAYTTNSIRTLQNPDSGLHQRHYRRMFHSQWKLHGDGGIPDFGRRWDTKRAC